MTPEVQATTRGGLIRKLALASIAGQLVWIAIVVAGGFLEPGYNEARDAVSVLGARNAAHPWLFDVGVAVWGLSFIAAAAGLALDAPRGWRGRLGPALIALTGIAQILTGFPFPADCRWSIDPQCHALDMAGELSWRHYAHGLAYFYGAGALQLSVFAMAWRFRGDSRWGRSDLLAFYGGLIGLAIFSVLFFATENEVNGHYGIVQRLTLGAAMAWVGTLTVGLLAIHGRARDPAVRVVERVRTLPIGRLFVQPRSGIGGSPPERPG